LGDIVTTDFMKGIISEMNLDIDPSQVNDLVGQLGEKKEEKKEENKQEHDADKK
jgi:hypothetical protein